MPLFTMVDSASVRVSRVRAISAEPSSMFCRSGPVPPKAVPNVSASEDRAVTSIEFTRSVVWTRVTSSDRGIPSCGTSMRAPSARYGGSALPGMMSSAWIPIAFSVVIFAVDPADTCVPGCSSMPRTMPVPSSFTSTELILPTPTPR